MQATPDQDQVSLSVDGFDYGGWLSCEITAGIERQARDFRLSITWAWPGQEARAVPIRQGAEAQVAIGGDQVLAGYVFATPIRYDRNRITLSIAGRSKPADLVDCAAASGQWRRQSVQQIVAALVAPYGIEVVSEVAETTALADHTVEPGETVFESVDRLLTLYRLFSTDDGAGRLVLASPGSAGRSPDVLAPGDQVLECDAPLDFSGVFSDYRVLGQRSGDDDAFGADASEVSAAVTDPRAPRYRLLVINEGGQVSPELAAARANWERGQRVGKALAVTYKVKGWRQSNGQLWRPNLLVRARDPLLGFDRDLLISEVTYSQTRDGGTVATLKLAPPEGFTPEPKDPHEARKVKKGGAADNFEYLLPPDWDKADA